jgi:hypothetical protein
VFPDSFYEASITLIPKLDNDTITKTMFMDQQDNIIKMATLLKAIYRVSAISIKIPIADLI